MNDNEYYLYVYKQSILLCFSVFWDLYCAAPERRDTCEHSSEAKAFHDYVSIYSKKECMDPSKPMILIFLTHWKVEINYLISHWLFRQ